MGFGAHPETRVLGKKVDCRSSGIILVLIYFLICVLNIGLITKMGGWMSF